MGDSPDDAEDPDAPIVGGASLARYASIGAHVRYFPRPEKAKVLEAFGFSPPHWDALQTEWQEAMRVDHAANGKLLARWNAAFEAAFARLEETRPSLASILDAAAEKAQAPAPAPVEVPSYLIGGSSAESMQQVPPAFGETAALSPDAPSGDLPFWATTQPVPTDKRKPKTMPFAIPTAPEPVDPKNSLAGGPGAPPPNPSTPAAAGPVLKFNEYAALKAQILSDPMAEDDAWRALGILTVAARAPVHAFWAQAFQRDPELKKKFAVLVQQYFAERRSRA